MNLLDKISKRLTDKDYKNLFENGIFVFDTNVLLDIYRLPNTAKEDLLSILENDKLSNRIWLPFQAHLEYIYNKNNVIREQKTKFEQVESLINKYQNNIHKLSNDIKKEISDLQLKKRHSLIDAENYINDELFNVPINQLNAFKEKLKELNKKQPDVTDNDKIGDRIKKIFKDKIGESFDRETINDIYKEGVKRYKNEVPPGYKDDTTEKEGSHFYEDKEYIRKYGDLLLWKEIIRKAIQDEVEYLVLVSSDVKEDWLKKNSGMYTSVRYELLNEIYFAAKKLKLFHIYDSSNFMKYAKQFLQLEVDDSSIQEAKEIQEPLFPIKRKVIRTINSIAEEYIDLGYKVYYSGLKDYSPSLNPYKADLLGNFMKLLFTDTLFENTDDTFHITLYQGEKNPNTINLHIEMFFHNEQDLKDFADYTFKQYPKNYADLGVFTFRKNFTKSNRYTLTIEILILP